MNSKENKWNRRDKKRHNRKHGMRVNGKSVFTLEAVKVKKAQTTSKKGNK